MKPADPTTERPHSLSAVVWRRFARHRSAVAGASGLLIILVSAALGLLLAGNAAIAQGGGVRLTPSGQHLFGTDDLGRSILARVAYGAHLTLGTGAAIVLLAAGIGIPLGLVSATGGARLDNLLMRCMDMVLAFPSILLAIAMVAALGFNLRNIVLAVGIVYVPKFARVTRAAALAEATRDYVHAAEALGCGRVRILARHILPNCAGPLLVLATLSLATAILEAAALSFLGLGAQPPMPEWGRMLNDGRQSFLTHPHIMFFPGIAIAATVLCMNLVGDGLRDALDVRLERAPGTS